MRNNIPTGYADRGGPSGRGLRGQPGDQQFPGDLRPDLPQDRLCEGNCVIEQSGHGTVTIGAVETYITETAWAKGWIKPVKPARELDQSVGIIGAGPAGQPAPRSCAGAARSRSTIATTGSGPADRHPNFKLEKPVVERRAKLIGGPASPTGSISRSAATPASRICASATTPC